MPRRSIRPVTPFAFAIPTLPTLYPAVMPSAMTSHRKCRHSPSYPVRRAYVPPASFPRPPISGHFGKSRSRLPSPRLASRNRPLPPPGAPCLLPPADCTTSLPDKADFALLSLPGPGLLHITHPCFIASLKTGRYFYSLLICDLLHCVSQDTNSPKSLSPFP